MEAGLRSFDRTMPEEVNRLLTDQISDVLFVTSSDAIDNLLKEGVDRSKILPGWQRDDRQPVSIAGKSLEI